MIFAFYLVTCFIIGSIPFAYIIPKVFKGVDIRSVGSMNPGATNVRRILGWKYGLSVLLLDALKGMLALYTIHLFEFTIPNISLTTIQILGGLCSVFGHIYSPFLFFKGGKGVATSLGVFLYLAPYSCLLAICIFVFVIKIWKIVSIGTLLAAFFLPIFYYSLSYFKFIEFSFPLFFTMIIVFILIIFRHRSNIKRILNGTEFKIGYKQSLSNHESNGDNE